jgi:serpin B
MEKLVGRTVTQKFAFSLLAQQSLRQPGGSVFISPYSIAVALSLAEAGTTFSGQHAAAFEAVLGRPAPTAALSAVETTGCELLSSYSVWSRSGILGTYKTKVRKLFKASAEPMPSDASPINERVAQHTRGKITELIQDQTVQEPLVQAILVNAVFFKGSWSSMFEVHATKQANFFVPDAPEGGIPCMMMHKEEKVLFYQSHLLGQVVTLPYVDGAVRAMFVLPPMAGHPDGLSAARAVVATLNTHSGKKEWSRSRPYRKAKVDLRLPRFRMEYGVSSLKQSLSAMGLEVVFRVGGGFLNMSNDPSVIVSDVLHKAMVEVNEEGTVAAAASAVVTARKFPAPIPVVTFDRPFLMIIEGGSSNETLFAGLIASPDFNVEGPASAFDTAQGGQNCASASRVCFEDDVFLSIIKCLSLLFVVCSLC